MKQKPERKDEMKGERYKILEPQTRPQMNMLDLSHLAEGLADPSADAACDYIGGCIIHFLAEYRTNRLGYTTADTKAMPEDEWKKLVADTIKWAEKTLEQMLENTINELNARKLATLDDDAEGQTENYMDDSKVLTRALVILLARSRSTTGREI